jgi:hypothetical protein
MPTIRLNLPVEVWRKKAHGSPPPWCVWTQRRPRRCKVTTIYTWRDVRFGERFAEIYTEAPGDGRWVVDYGRLHETEPTGGKE